jgi:N-sulfoglucosamine sulfohydrolase
MLFLRSTPAKPVEFTLSLRLPPGCGEVSVETASGALVQRFTNHIEIRRTWSGSERVMIGFDFQIQEKRDRNGEYYLKWGPLVFALPLQEERKAIHEFAALDGKLSGFHRWEIRPVDETPLRYHFAKQASFSMETLPGGDRNQPWANPPVGLKGQLLNERGQAIPVTLKPLGSSLLRKTTFPKPKSDAPNLILIIGDDISADDFGCYGHPSIRTPELDALAASGIRFTNAYLTTSQCSPTRCSVITGRYPHNTGAPELHQELPPGQPLFPLLLKEAGYYTAAAGKWHLGEYARSAFDRIERSGPGGEERWVQVLKERPTGQPFFMWFASVDAHRKWDDQTKFTPSHSEKDAVIPPYMVDTPATRKDLARYYDEIARLDYYVGEVVRELKRQKVFDNTLVVFMADNGRPFPRCKTWLYDGGIKTPLIVNWPGGGWEGSRVERSLISAIDLAPTFLDLASVAIPRAIQGVSLVPLLNGSANSVRTHVFAEHNWHDMEAHERMVRWDNFKYIRNARPQLANWVHAHRDTPPYQDLLEARNQGTLTEAQADVLQVPRVQEQLFALKEDPNELNNWVGNLGYRATLEYLRGKLDEWQDRTGDTVPEVLTGDLIDRETFEWRFNPRQMPRGTTPGSERNAQAIHDPGPR